MPRLLVAITMLVLAGVVPADAFHTEIGPAKWSLEKVSPSGRYLVIAGAGGGCAGPLQVTDVRESAKTVALTVEQSQGVPDGPFEACTADYKFLTVGVRLNAPLAGRKLIGQWRFGLARSWAEVPRMVGARAGDAMRALANRSVHARLLGPVDGTVLRQSPAAGQPFSQKGITLVSRAATRTRKATPCHRLVVRGSKNGALPMTVRSVRNTTCGNGGKVFRAVSDWADRFYPDLLASAHPNTLGYKCAVDEVGDSYWNLRCVRGAHVIRATTAS
jgi:hypothetical protein